MTRCRVRRISRPGHQYPKPCVWWRDQQAADQGSTIGACLRSKGDLAAVLRLIFDPVKAAVSDAEHCVTRPRLITKEPA